MRIGVIDLDTSHPVSFAPLLAGRGHELVAVHGGHTVVDDAWTAGFAREHGFGRVVDDPADMIGDIDVAMLHSVNWDTHVDRLRPLVEAGVPAKVCKPFAGNAADIAQLERWVADGARIAGGSALRWSSAATDNAGEQVASAFAVTWGHVLDYGIHAFSLLHGIVGPGIEAARALDDEGRRVQVRWRAGTSAVVDVPPAGQGYGFHAALAGPGGFRTVDANGIDLYGPFLDATLAHLFGERDLPITFAELVEPELAIIAAKASAAHGGEWIDLRGDDRIADGSFDGAAFARDYARTRRAALGLPPRD